MNQHIKFFGGKAWLLVVMLSASAPVMAAPPAVPPSPVPQQVPRSVFNIPANPKEGRDPFFPTSMRPFQAPDVPGNHAQPDISALVLQGILGAPPHQLATINNVTFGVGEDGEVRTSQGRISIRLVEINGNSVVIEANGQEHTLHYGDK